MRYIVHDEDGPLRKFYTRAEALAWMGEGMHLVVLPKIPKFKPAKPDWFLICGEALL